MNIHLLEQSGKKIEYVLNGNKFILTDENGSTYTFSLNGSFFKDNTSNVNEWYLTKIESVKGDNIDFVYDITGVSQYSIDIPSYAEKHAYGYRESGIPNCDNFLSEFNDPIITTSSNSTIYLQKIVFSSGEVEFYRDTINYREDKHNRQRLSKIEVSSANGLTKEFELLNDSYFVTSGGAGGYASEVEQFVPYDLDIYANKRLKLTGVVEKNGIKENKKYEFVYNGTPLPSKTSYSIDYWGYYNGKGNSTFLPETEMIYTNSNGASVPKIISGADRKPDLNFAKAASLEKIIYPTGGATEFEYALNEWDIPAQITYVVDSRTVRISKFPNTNTFTYTGFSSPSIEDFVVNKDAVIHIQGALLCNYEKCGSFTPEHPPYYKISGNSIQDIFVYYEGTSATANGEKNTYALDDYISLTPGSYKMELIYNSGTQDILYDSRITASMTWKEQTDQVLEIIDSEQGSGLRVENIKHYDNDGSKKLEKSFVYKNGKLMSPYLFSKTERCVQGNDDNNTLIVYGNSIGDLATSAQGSYVGYSDVDMYYDEQKSQGKTSYAYDNEKNKFAYNLEPNLRTPGVSGAINESNGNILLQTDYRKQGSNYFKRKEIINTYADKSTSITPIWGIIRDLTFVDYVLVFGGGDPVYNKQYDLNIYYIPTNTIWNRLDQSKELLYDDNEILLIETERNYFYDNPTHKLLTRTETTDSDGKTIETSTIFPDDIKTATTLQDDSLINGGTLGAAFNAVDRLKQDDLHQIATPVQVETMVKNGATILSQTIQRTNFSEPFTDLVLPKDVQTLKGTYNASTNPLEDRIIYNDYYDNGNVKEISKANGVHIIYVWGYNGQYPIAKIENATFTGLPSNVQTIINTAVSASDNDIDITTENSLRIALDNLRTQFPNAMVTTYTYDPLIGVTSMTDPKGYTMFYEYDDFNRLEFVKDANGKLLSKNEYHYKGQQ